MNLSILWPEGYEVRTLPVFRENLSILWPWYEVRTLPVFREYCGNIGFTLKRYL